MFRVPHTLLVPLAAAITLTTGLAAAPSPADAAKIVRAAAGAAAGTAKSAARAATHENAGSDSQAAPDATKPAPTATDRAAAIEAAAARAKAQLDQEKGSAALATTSGQAAPPATGVVCVAGCGFSRTIGR